MSYQFYLYVEDVPAGIPDHASERGVIPLWSALQQLDNSVTNFTVGGADFNKACSFWLRIVNENYLPAEYSQTTYGHIVTQANDM